MDTSSTPDIWGSIAFQLQEFMNKPPTGPLGKVVDKVFRFKADERIEGGDLPVIRALTNWYRFQKIISMNIFGFDAFSKEQQNSYCLLFDWWTAALQHPMVTFNHLRLFTQLSPTLLTVSRELQQREGKPSGHDCERLLYYISKHMDILNPGRDIYDENCFQSEIYNDYNTAMLNLFVAEFAYPCSKDKKDTIGIVKQLLTADLTNCDSEDEKFDIDLKKWRRNAAIQSYCRQAGIECLRNIMPSLLVPSVKAFDPEDEIFSVRASIPKFRHGFNRGPLIPACPWLSIPYVSKYQDSEDEDDEIYEISRNEKEEKYPFKRWNKEENEEGSEEENGGENGVENGEENKKEEEEKGEGENKQKNKRKNKEEEENEEERQKERSRESKFDRLGGWPEYLWDLARSRTVPTSTLGHPRPSYTTISHTWGRTVVPGPGYLIPGGLPYPVPPNSAFGFNTLSDDLKALQGRISSSYIWLDLLCIPQGHEDDISEEDKKVRLRDIGKQREIFDNAEFSIAWLHDVDDLSCLADVFQWLCVSIFNVQDGTEDARIRDQHKERLSQRIKYRRTGLVKRGKIKDMDELAVLVESGGDAGVTVGSSWFNSLWTFQELCLRPDTYLATSSLGIMSLETGHPIPMSGLVCVYNQFVSMGKLGEENPSAIQDISDWHRCTRLGQLLDFTRIDILSVGARRYCKERRAEAIMSATGATSWFIEALARSECNTWGDTSTGYNPEFIREMRNIVSQEPMIALSAGPGVNDERQYDIRMNGKSATDPHALKLYSHSLSETEKFISSLPI